MSDNNLFLYDDEWDKKNLSIDLLSTNYNYNIISSNPINGLFLFPLFSRIFCEQIVEKLKEFSEWSENRHKNYPTNDVLIEDFDENFDKIYTSILENIILPGVNKLYEATFEKNTLEYETFIIRYNPKKQAYLDYHHDNSIFTVCNTFSFANEYIGGGTIFSQHNNSIIKANAGECIIHPGVLTHRHGVKPITWGERYSMVTFCRKKIEL